MEPDRGEDPGEGGSNGWVLLEAAESGEGTGDEAENSEDDGDLEDLVDNTPVAQGDSLPLHTRLLAETDDRAVQELRKRYVGDRKTKPDELSPRLCAIRITARRGSAKRKLFQCPLPDSGYANSMEESLQGPVAQGEQCTQVSAPRGETGESVAGEGAGMSLQELLRCGKPRAAMLGEFKTQCGVSYTDLTRSFKSDRTVCTDWVAVVFGVPCSLEDAVSDILRPHCMFSHVSVYTCRSGIMAVLLIRWLTAKSRETVRKLLCTALAVEAGQILTDPPQIRDPAAAMYWYKKSMVGGCTVFGEMLEWITRHVCLTRNTGEASMFSLAKMIQTAYDNGWTTEPQVAYEYAKLADEDTNAEAFLASNSQAKYVKDCCYMVRQYKKAEMDAMTTGQWIEKRIADIEGDGDWKVVVKALRHQGVEFVTFMQFFKKFLKGIPKHNCLCLYGPPNTGKSLFGMSLIDFMGGKVISHVNCHSHFWLQPLAECKLGMLDDATAATWDYIDMYLRNLLDGNAVCIDAKHKAPTQIKAPPLLVTSNIDVREKDKWKYLRSRVKVVGFPNECPLDRNGDPQIMLTAQHWKSFFKRCWARLDLNPVGLQVEGNNGDNGCPLQPLRCTAREANGPL
nr:E1 [Dyodeltapapillomavirus sp.]WGU21310.1 E1 [Firstpapillomavirinae PV-HMU-2]